MHPTEIRHRARQALQTGDLDRALTLLESGVAEHPGQIQLSHDLAECQWAAYNFQRALAIYEAAWQTRPNASDLAVAAAKKLFGLGRFAESARWLERAVAAAPADAALWAMAAEVYDRDHQLAEAERCARLALERDPSHTKGARILAHVEQRLGRIDEARRRLRAHLARHPGPEDWRLRYELAEILDHAGDYSAAIGELFLAKEQLRPRAFPLLAEARAIQASQRAFAVRLTRADLLAWQRGFTPCDPRRLVFLCGHPRSGTTLWEQMLAAHGEAITTDETGVLQREFIQPLLRATTAEASHSELGQLDSEQIAAGRSAYWRCTEAHLGEAVGARLLVEKDPSLTPDLPLPLRLFPEAKVVFPVRDPRDVCLSYFFNLIPLAASSAAALDLAATCEACAHTLELWARWKSVLPFPLFESHYERLVADPEGESRRLLDFLELPWRPAVLSFHTNVRAQRVRTPTYADVRQPIYRRAVGRWKNYEPYLRPHLALLEPHLERLGYS